MCLIYMPWFFVEPRYNKSLVKWCLVQLLLCPRLGTRDVSLAQGDVQNTQLITQSLSSGPDLHMADPKRKLNHLCIYVLIKSINASLFL